MTLRPTAKNEMVALARTSTPLKRTRWTRPTTVSFRAAEVPSESAKGEVLTRGPIAGRDGERTVVVVRRLPPAIRELRPVAAAGLEITTPRSVRVPARRRRSRDRPARRRRGRTVAFLIELLPGPVPLRGHVPTKGARRRALRKNLRHCLPEGSPTSGARCSGVSGADARHGRRRRAASSAIWAAFSAAPLRRLSLARKSASPVST